MTSHERARTLALGCSLLLGVSAFATDAPRNPSEVYGPRIGSTASTTTAAIPTPERRSSQPADGLRFWNQVAIDASGLDHTPVAAAETRRFGEQLGPGRSARAIAIVQIAAFDAVNAINGGYRSFTNQPRFRDPANLNSAIATASYLTLVRMFPSQKPRLDGIYARDIARLPRNDRAVINGILVGTRAAASILSQRANDGSAGADPRMDGEWPTNPAAGHWRQDPIGLAPIALGAHWGKVKPFVMRSPAQFRAPAPPAMSSEAYTRAYEEVKALGGDGVHTPTMRTAEQSFIGVFWAYDGTPSLCAPPRLYNQIVTQISRDLSDATRLARLYALVNVAMADSGIAGWESKFYWDFWRPVTGIREADAGTGPTGAGDGNPATVGDPTFHPLGAPASNLVGPNFTPPFPAYPSGHATFGGALFETLRNFYGTDAIEFTFTSDEFNGATVGNDGVVRPLRPRTFRTLSQAEEENGQSRIYLGIHWSFDKTEGIRQGRRVADYVYANAFQKVN